MEQELEAIVLGVNDEPKHGRFAPVNLVANPI